mgnify:CR=1 FL=1
MSRKFEIKSTNYQALLEHQERIAVFCDALGNLADQSGKPIQLQLVIHPQEKKCCQGKLPKLPYN